MLKFIFQGSCLKQRSPGSLVNMVTTASTAPGPPSSLTSTSSSSPCISSTVGWTWGWMPCWLNQYKDWLGNFWMLPISTLIYFFQIPHVLKFTLQDMFRTWTAWRFTAVFRCIVLHFISSKPYQHHDVDWEDGGLSFGSPGTRPASQAGEGW